MQCLHMYTNTNVIVEDLGFSRSINSFEGISSWGSAEFCKRIALADIKITF